jgi:hypothetical protein
MFRHVEVGQDAFEYRHYLQNTFQNIKEFTPYSTIC